MTLFDTHTHSCFSNDGCEKLSDIYSKAVSLGLSSLAITDHYDIDVMQSGIDEQVLSDGYFALNRLRDETADSSTKIYCGIELGAAVCDAQKAKKIISEHDYDIIIGSLHGITGQPEYYLQGWQQMSDDEINCVLLEYFEMQLKNAQLGLFDTLAHLDYPTRYLRRINKSYDISRFSAIIDNILKTLVLNKKALEINTSGLRDCFKATLPDFDIIKRFFELGGEYITIGSDAHNVNDICRDFDVALRLAYDCGFRDITYFEKRKPHKIKIEL